MGWQVPWYSADGSDFNYDFHVSFDDAKAPLEYNYLGKAELERTMPFIRSGADGPGVSVFLRDGDRVFHTYSAYARGLDSVLGIYHWLDLTPLGRQDAPPRAAIPDLPHGRRRPGPRDALEEAKTCLGS
jgi:predicted dithiol-disulfide oxidoreductase (DUF899 family)